MNAGLIIQPWLEPSLNWIWHQFTNKTTLMLLEKVDSSLESSCKSMVTDRALVAPLFLFEKGNEKQRRPFFQAARSPRS